MDEKNDAENPESKGLEEDTGPKASPKEDTKEKSGQENEETEKKTKTSEEEAEQKTPMFLYLLGVAVIITAVAAFYIVSNPVITQVNNGAIVETDAIEALLIYSDGCVVCEKSNTFELALVANGIEYERRDIEAGSTEGQKLVQELEINILPSLLLREKDISPETDIMLQNNASISLREFLAPYMQGEWFVIGEEQVANNLVPKMFLEVVDSSCLSNPSTLRVDEFADYLDKPSFDARIIVRKLLNETFEGEVEYFFHNNIINDPASEYIALSAECIRDQGEEEFKLFNASFFERFFEKREFQMAIGSDILPTREIRDQNLLDQKLLEIINNIGNIDVNQYQQCIQGIPNDEDSAYTDAQLKLLNDAELVGKYGIKPILPQYVIDCKYVIAGSDNLAMKICALHPELDGCSDAELDVAREDKACTQDSDCIGIVNSCGNCNCGTIINKENTEKYENLLDMYCQNYQGEMCTLSCERIEIKCQNLKCGFIPFSS